MSPLDDVLMAAGLLLAALGVLGMLAALPLWSWVLAVVSLGALLLGVYLLAISIRHLGKPWW